MGRLIYTPFEDIPQRYTTMWNAAVKRCLSEDDLYIASDETSQVIRTGEFLDTYGTISYKMRQVEKISSMFKDGLIRDGDIFFIPDIFYPGIEAIKYMAELTGIKVKIATFNHAGRADEDDFVQKLSLWADTQEKAWHEMSDLVLVGSFYQKKRVQKKFHTDKIAVTGAIWDKTWMDSMCEGIDKEKEDYIIYPHRPCKEKRFDFFLDCARANPQLRFVITSCGLSRLNTNDLPRNVEYRYGLTKKQYFETFAKANGYLSTAYQETFGYTLQEAIYFGCKVVCPNYACYPEYAAAESIVDFDAMKKPGFLTELFLHSNDLTRSKQFEDNAKTVIELIKTL